MLRLVNPNRGQASTAKPQHSVTGLGYCKTWLRIHGPLRRSSYLGLSLSAFLLILGTWFTASHLAWFDAVFLPGPWQVVQRGGQWLFEENLLADIWISIYRVTAGFILSALLALPLALLIGTFKPIQALFEPLIEFARYLPAVAFVPLILLWVGIGESAKISLIWLGTFFQMVLLLAEDVRRVPRSQIEAAQTLGASRGEILQLVILKSAMPNIVDSLRITLGWAWTYLVVAELVAANSGLGYQILKAQRFLQTDKIFAGILLIGLLGLCMDQLVRRLHQRCFPWLYIK